jgi:hypothetical protein
VTRLLGAEPVHGFQPGVEQGFAPTKRLQTHFVNLGLSPHTLIYGRGWLKFS